MLIQEVQSLKSKTEQLEEEITRLKNRWVLFPHHLSNIFPDNIKF
jgi:hypothetical protein